MRTPYGKDYVVGVIQGCRRALVVMMDIPEDLRYTKGHEWARLEESGVRVGITDYAQEELTDIVYVELPEAGRALKQGEPFGVVESIKSTSDLYSPVGGTVKGVNARLVEHPELVNQDPYGEGWMILIEPSGDAGFDALMSAGEYAAYLRSGQG